MEYNGIHEHKWRYFLMKLFTLGPVAMYPETLKIAGQQLPYFRTSEFSKIMLENEQRLKDLLHLTRGYIAMLTGSGTAAMEAVVACCLGKENRVLIINGGSFGARFVQLCDCYHIPYDTLKVPFGTALTQEQLNAIDGSQYDALLVNIHETSTGQLYSLSMLSNFVKKHGLYFIVDAISSFGADLYQMDDYGVDCTILSSQKALALSPGISMVAMQESFYKEMVEMRRPQNLYLNLREHVLNMERGQTPFTPHVGALLELHDRLQQIEQQGMEVMCETSKQRAEYFRTEVKKLGIRIPDYPLSNALTPILLQGNAEDVFHILKDKYDIIVTPSGGDLKDKLLRIGHLGNQSMEDYKELLLRLKECVL